MTAALRPGRGGLLLSVRVTPKSSKDRIAGLHRAADGAVSLAVKVAAPPDKGKANAAVTAILAKAAGLPKSALSIVAGETDRHKTILVSGNAEKLQALIAILENRIGKDDGETD
ncbi:MAG: DUF167 domain-containing protein [Rhizobiales bacterium]|nr:DUF167 domain-containing protein [Hyphomicrobiales bacterium]